MAVTKLMEEMAVAILKGDEAAALALSDLIQENYRTGTTIPPITRLNVDADRLRMIFYIHEDYSLSDFNRGEMRQSVEDWLRCSHGVLTLAGVTKTEIYELPPKPRKRKKKSQHS